MNRKEVFSHDESYHLYNRGVDKRVIFMTDGEYLRFQSLLFICNGENKIHMSSEIARKFSMNEVLDIKKKRGAPLVAIAAYCLMPNHFHILITPLVDVGISKFMQRVQTAYSMYFNIKQERSGALFQGAFKSTHADSDEYLKYLYAYIHLNPAKLQDPKWKESIVNNPETNQEIFNFVTRYPYSSIGEYMSGNFLICNPDPFPEYFTEVSGRGSVLAELADWLSLDMEINSIQGETLKSKVSPSH